jgi:ferredoxin/flavodoxin---NADP+ reductase
MLVPNMYQTTLEAPEIARSVKPGQFVILRTDEEGERIPLTVSDWDPQRGTISLVYLTIGQTTQQLARMKAGAILPTVVGPLGNAIEIDYYGSVICVGGCYGIASIYPIARALKEKGNRVISIVEARSSFLLYWQEKLKSVSDQLIVITRDGSKGMTGHIGNLTKIIPSLPHEVDRVIINGCNYLLMRGAQETEPFKIKTIVSLNTLMIDGTGMCGVCRLTVNTTTKFACVDGPHFDGHEVNWDEMTKRRRAYLSEEATALRSSGAE